MSSELGPGRDKCDLVKKERNGTLRSGMEERSVGIDTVCAITPRTKHHLHSVLCNHMDRIVERDR